MPKLTVPLHELRQRLHILASEPRLRILAELKRKRSRTVGELVEALRMPYPVVSQHLRVLRLAGMVRVARRGLHKAYRLPLSQREPAKSIVGML
jgi:DNA-binding transcriptional ArsR family regulator